MREAFHSGTEPVEILLASPAEQDHEYFCLLFPKPDWRVHFARSVEEASWLLGTQSIEVLVCERDLTDGNWSNVLGIASTMSWRPPVIVISRDADEALWAEVLHSGGYDVLLKPFDPAEVRRVLGTAVRRRQRDGASQVQSVAALTG